MSGSDTIFAQASAAGKAGVAVIRLSGPKAWSATSYLAGKLPAPRVLSLRRLVDPEIGLLDQALVVCFEKLSSFTGEEVCELHLHGSTATVSAVLRALGRVNGLRLADPGEFTRRALENGRLDLAQVEGLGDLLEAETEAQRLQALRVFSGALGEKVEVWRKSLIRAVSLIEATIDFADEDIPVDVFPEVFELCKAVYCDLSQDIVGSYISERIRDGFEVAIVGPPNSGKSTLLNRLAGRDAAITSSIAGTTRDVVEVRMDLAGIPVTVLDTAGIRESQDEIEIIGIERARQRAASADVRVFLLEDSSVEEIGVVVMPDDIIVRGKSDLLKDYNGLTVSGNTGEGVELLLNRLSELLKTRASGGAIAIRERHRMAMIEASGFLKSVLGSIEVGGVGSEFLSAEIHQSIAALNSLIGRVDIEQVLDDIFSSFCLGK